MMLDFSSAFDTVDHGILINKLKHNFSINNDALILIKSFLTHRQFSVKINKSTSQIKLLKYGVPQGSQLGPLLYILYTKDIAKIAEKHGVQIMMYADDTQLFVPFEIENLEHIKIKLTNCLKDITFITTPSSLISFTGSNVFLSIVNLNFRAILFGLKSY